MKYITQAVDLNYTVGEFAVEIGGKPQVATAKPAGIAQQGAGKKLIEAKLKKIILPAIDFDNTTLSKAVEFFRQRSIQLDPEPDPNRKGVNILIRLNKKEQEALKNMPLSAALKFTTEAVGLTYKVSEFAVEIGKE